MQFACLLLLPMADTSLHRQGVALYRALVKLMPDGADRLETNLHEIVTKGGATRAFTVDGELNEAAIKQAWRYLVSIGSVQNLGPRFKRPLREPARSAAAEGATKSTRAKRASTAKKATRKTVKKSTKRAGARRGRPSTRGAGRGRATAARSNGAGSINLAESVPAPSVLAGQLTGFQAQLEESLGTLEQLRQQINDSYDQLARLEDEHNAVVRDLLAFRESLADTNQRSFVDSIVGDNLWSYAPRA